MKIRIKPIYSFSESVILLLLFFGNMNVGNLYFYFIFLACFVCIFVHSRNVKIDILFVVLTLFSLCYLVAFPGARNSLTTIIKQFIYPMSYLIGLNFTKQVTEQSELRINEQKLSAFFVVPAIGMFVHYLLNLLVNYSSISRNTIDIWTDKVISATGQACLAVLATAVFFSMLFCGESKTKKLVALFGLLVIFAYNLVLAGRTLLLLMVIVFCVSFGYKVQFSNRKQKAKTIFLVMIVVLSVFAIYVQDLFGVRNWILGSNLSNRFDRMNFMDDSRLINKYLYVRNMLKYPLGGGLLRKDIGGYAHELYLDTYSDSGILGYTLIVCFVVASVVRWWRFLKRIALGREIKLLVLCLYLVTLIQFHLEPILQGMPWLFSSFCFYSGLISGVRKEYCNEDYCVANVS